MKYCVAFVIFNCFILINAYDILLYKNFNSCNNSEYLNVNLMKCEFCDPEKNLIPTTNKQSCTCNGTSVPKNDISNLFPIKCEKCPNNMIFSKNTNKCMICANGYQIINQKASCKTCRDNEILMYKYLNGSLLSETICLPCSNGMVPSNDGKECIPCPILNPLNRNGTIMCVCDYKKMLLGNICVEKNKYPNLSNNKKKYNLRYDNGAQVDSYLFENYLRSNILLCKMENETACQFLANLCTLTLFYNYDNSPCNLWTVPRYGTNNLINLPWLYYSEGEATIILNRKSIPAQFSFNAFSKLNFTAIVFNLNGTVKEIKNLHASDFNLCPGLDHLKDDSFRFGLNYQQQCAITAKQFFSNKDTEFFVPFLQFWENDVSKLYAVPILIRNLEQYKNNDEDRSKWQLVRRYFQYDIVSSISSKNLNPTVLRYVKSIEINVQLINDGNPGEIYPPLIILEYGEISHPSESNSWNDKINFKFSIRYQLKTKLTNSMETCVGILCGFAILYSGLQSWTYYKRTKKNISDYSLLIRFFVIISGNLANTFFVVAFGASFYTYTLYKLQRHVNILAPTEHENKIVKQYLITSFIFKLFEILTLIWDQISIDIFFIDWEKPKPQDNIPRPKKLTVPFTLTSCDEKFVSIWRSCFIANEWSQIQTLRKINIQVHMFALLFLLKVVGLANWSSLDPKSNNTIPEYENNSIFIFALGSSLYICIYILQLLFMCGFYERYIKNSIQQFVDLCSLANISIFILSLETYGYYIHGRSSLGFADKDMATMLRQLKREEDDLCAHRGLLPGSHQQTFTLIVPLKFRLNYNKILASINTADIPDYGHDNTLDSMKIDRFEKITQSYNNMNRFLSAFLEHALKDIDYDIKDKQLIESLFGIEIMDYDDRSIFYNDNGHSFDGVLFYGNEFSLFTFDIILFSFLLILNNNYILTVLMTWFLVEVLNFVRRFGGKRNFSRKTLIDKMFLM